MKKAFFFALAIQQSSSPVPCTWPHAYNHHAISERLRSPRATLRTRSEFARTDPPVP